MAEPGAVGRDPERPIAVLDGGLDKPTGLLRGQRRDLATTAIIRAARPDAWFVHNDALEAFTPAEPGAAEPAAFKHELRFVGLDLVRGRPLSPTMRTQLFRSRLHPGQLEWL